MRYIFVVLTFLFSGCAQTADHETVGSLPYNMGSKQGTKNANAAWDNLQHECDKLDEYELSMTDAIDRLSGPEYADKHPGFRDGMRDGILKSAQHNAKKDCDKDIAIAEKKSPTSADKPASSQTDEKDGGISSQSNKSPCEDKKQSSKYMGGCKLGKSLVESAWEDLSKEPKAGVVFPRVLTKVLATQEKKLDTYDAEQLQGYVAGVKAALTIVETKCKCDLKKPRQTVEGWLKKSSQTAKQPIDLEDGIPPVEKPIDPTGSDSAINLPSGQPVLP